VFYIFVTLIFINPGVLTPGLNLSHWHHNILSPANKQCVVYLTGSVVISQTHLKSFGNGIWTHIFIFQSLKSLFKLNLVNSIFGQVSNIPPTSVLHLQLVFQNLLFSCMPISFSGQITNQIRKANMMNWHKEKGACGHDFKFLVRSILNWPAVYGLLGIKNIMVRKITVQISLQGLIFLPLKIDKSNSPKPVALTNTYRKGPWPSFRNDE